MARLLQVALVTIALLAGMIVGAVSAGRARELPPIMMRRGAHYMLDVGYARTYSMGRQFTGVPDEYTADSPAGPRSLTMRGSRLLQAAPYTWVVHTMYRTAPDGAEYMVKDDVNAVYWEPGMENVMVHVAGTFGIMLYLLDVATDDLTLIDNELLYSRCADAHPHRCLFMSGNASSARRRLTLLDVNTGETQRIATGNLNDNVNHWSPDGERFVYVRIRNGAGVVYLHEVATGTASPLFRLPVSGIYVMEWSADGAWVRVSALANGTIDALQIASVSGEQPPMDIIAQHPGLAACTRWSPTQPVIICRTEDTDEDIHHLHTLTLPAGNLEPLITVGSSRTPQYVWAPNGTRLALQLERNSKFPLYVVPLDDPHLQLIHGNNTTSSTLRWQTWQTDDFKR